MRKLKLILWKFVTISATLLPVTEEVASRRLLKISTDSRHLFKPLIATVPTAFDVKRLISSWYDFLQGYRKIIDQRYRVCHQ